MKKYSIIGAGLIGVTVLAIATITMAKVGIRIQDKTVTTGVSSTTVRTRVEARLGSSTPIGHTMSSTTRAAAMQDKITNEQKRSDNEINNRIEALNKLLVRINAMTKISVSQKSSFDSSIQSEIASLTALKNSIDTDTSTSSLKTDLQSITKSYRIYALIIPQASITAAADRVLDLVSSFNTLSTKLQGYITTAQSNGVNVSSAVSAMSDITAKVADAGTQANAAISEVAGLQPDQGATSTLETNTAALKNAQLKVKAATADLTAARKDVNTIVEVIKGSMKLGGGAPVTASTTASTTTQ